MTGRVEGKVFRTTCQPGVGRIESEVRRPWDVSSGQLLEADDIAAGYGRSGDVIHNVSIQVAEGHITYLCGANGAGKTTLLKVLGGLIPARKGRIYINGSNISGHTVAEFVQAGIVLCAEGRYIFNELTVYDNLFLGAYSLVRKRRRQRIRDRLEVVYDLFPALAGFAGRRAGELSGGEQQMVAIGRSLMADPRFLLLDEPTLGLAPAMVTRLLGAVAQAARGGLAILVAEEPKRPVAEIADGIVVLDLGRIRP